MFRILYSFMILLIIKTPRSEAANSPSEESVNSGTPKLPISDSSSSTSSPYHYSSYRPRTHPRVLQFAHSSESSIPSSTHSSSSARSSYSDSAESQKAKGVRRAPADDLYHRDKRSFHYEKGKYAKHMYDAVKNTPEKGFANKFKELSKTSFINAKKHKDLYQGLKSGRLEKGHDSNAFKRTYRTSADIPKWHKSRRTLEEKLAHPQIAFYRRRGANYLLPYNVKGEGTRKRRPNEITHPKEGKQSSSSVSTSSSSGSYSKEVSSAKRKQSHDTEAGPSKRRSTNRQRSSSPDLTSSSSSSA